MTADARPQSPARDLIRRLLWTPLYAVPFALFFGTLMGRDFRDYVGAYEISLVMAIGISLTLWVTEHSLVPFLQGRRILTP